MNAEAMAYKQRILDATPHYIRINPDELARLDVRLSSSATNVPYSAEVLARALFAAKIQGIVWRDIGQDEHGLKEQEGWRILAQRILSAATP